MLTQHLDHPLRGAVPLGDQDHPTALGQPGPDVRDRGLDVGYLTTRPGTRGPAFYPRGPRLAPWRCGTLRDVGRDERCAVSTRLCSSDCWSFSGSVGRGCGFLSRFAIRLILTRRRAGWARP